jgi:uncharacterized membrane protein YczE
VTGTSKPTDLPLKYQFVRRIVQLQLGLILYGLSMALMIRARLGLDPWDTFHQGVTKHLPLSFGTVVIITGALVLLFWIPLRQRPGIGTLSNVVMVGVAVDASLWLLPSPSALWLRVGLLVGGIVANGAATGMYIGARLGPGPRDGLMTGIVARTGRSVRLIRTGLEVTVLAVGFLLGGTVGIATILYAVSIGPLTQLFLPLFSVKAPQPVQSAAPDPAPA